MQNMCFLILPFYNSCISCYCFSLYNTNLLYNINSLLAKTSNRYQFYISLDTLLKVNSKMVQSMDKERSMGIIKHEKSIVDFFTGAGTGISVY